MLDDPSTLTLWNLSNVPENVGLANSNKHLNFRLGISSRTGLANTMGLLTELRHKDNGNSRVFILCTGTIDMSADDTSLLLNIGCAQSSLSVLLSTPESLEVIVLSVVFGRNGQFISHHTLKVFLKTFHRKSHNNIDTWTFNIYCKWQTNNNNNNINNNVTCVCVCPKYYCFRIIIS